MAFHAQPAALTFLFATAIFAGVACRQNQASAENFRVKNVVYVGNEDESKSESTTIFHEGLVYDYLEKPKDAREITVFDKARKRFILLDPARRVRTEISTDEVEGVSRNVRTLASTQRDAYSRWLASPKFEESIDEQTSELVFESQWITYRITAAKADTPAMAEQYREFSDWYSQLNTCLNPGYKQALVRMLINETLEKRGEIPEKVHLTLKAKAFSKTTMRSEHHVARLVESERKLVSQTDEYMAMYRSLDFQQYQETQSKPER